MADILWDTCESPDGKPMKMIRLIQSCHKLEEDCGEG